MIRAAALLLCLLCLGMFVRAEPRAAFASGDELSHWMMHYYRNPEPARIAQMVDSAGALGLLRGRDARAFIIGFVAGVLTKGPELLPIVSERIDALSPPEQVPLILAIWHAGGAEASATLTLIAARHPGHSDTVEKLLTQPPPRMGTGLSDGGPWHLDWLWGYFMATGEEAPVLRIIATLARVSAPGSVFARAPGYMARWSLTANAEQHPRVLAICKAQLPQQPAEVAKVLQEVIAKAEGRSSAAE